MITIKPITKFKSVLSAVLFFCNSLFANNEIEIKSFQKNVQSVTFLPDVVYFWGYGEGPCSHLYRIDNSGFIGHDGMFHEGFTVTLMTDNNFVGTHTICPPSGEWYV